MKTKLRLNIQVKFWKKGKLINSTCRRVKDRILSLAQKVKWDKAYIKVNYNRSFYNDGFYYNFKDLKEVLSIFTEKALLDFFMGRFEWMSTVSKTYIFADFWSTKVKIWFEWKATEVSFGSFSKITKNWMNWSMPTGKMKQQQK